MAWHKRFYIFITTSPASFYYLIAYKLFIITWYFVIIKNLLLNSLIILFSSLELTNWICSSIIYFYIKPEELDILQKWYLQNHNSYILQIASIQRKCSKKKARKQPMYTWRYTYFFIYRSYMEESAPHFLI